MTMLPPYRRYGCSVSSDIEAVRHIYSVSESLVRVEKIFAQYVRALGGMYSTSLLSV
jgi:hypothetical protein